MRSLHVLPLLGVLACASAATPAAEPEPAGELVASSRSNAPPSRQELTERAVRLYAEQAPELGAEIAGELTLRFTAPEREGQAVNLDRVWDVCRRVPSDCDDALADFVAQSIALLRERAPDAAPSAERLLPVLRPGDYAHMIRERIGQQGERFGPGLVALVVLDSPSAAQPVGTEQLRELAMSEAEAHARARDNLAARFAGFAETITPPPPGRLGRFPSDDFYATSVVLLHDAWAPAAERFERLLVAMPDPSLLVFVDGASEEAREGIRQAAAGLLQESRRPLSADVYEWTPEGWQMLPR